MPTEREDEGSHGRLAASPVDHSRVRNSRVLPSPQHHLSARRKVPEVTDRGDECGDEVVVAQPTLQLVRGEARLNKRVIPPSPIAPLPVPLLDPGSMFESAYAGWPALLSGQAANLGDDLLACEHSTSEQPIGARIALPEPRPTGVLTAHRGPLNDSKSFPRASITDTRSITGNQHPQRGQDIDPPSGPPPGDPHPTHPADHSTGDPPRPRNCRMAAFLDVLGSAVGQSREKGSRFGAGVAGSV